MSSILEASDNGKSTCLKYLKYLIFTGEPIPKNLTNKIYKKLKDIEIYNAYGTTETSIISNWNFVNNFRAIYVGALLGASALQGR